MCCQVAVGGVEELLTSRHSPYSDRIDRGSDCSIGCLEMCEDSPCLPSVLYEFILGLRRYSCLRFDASEDYGGMREVQVWSRRPQWPVNGDSSRAASFYTNFSDKKHAIIRRTLKADTVTAEQRDRFPLQTAPHSLKPLLHFDTHSLGRNTLHLTCWNHTGDSCSSTPHPSPSLACLLLPSNRSALRPQPSGLT